MGPAGLPVATLHVKSKKGFWMDVDAIVDSGADFTYLPNKLAKELGISLKEDCRPIRSHGVGGAAVGYFCKKSLSCRIGPMAFELSIVFSSNDRIPPLFGRFRGLDRFHVCLDGRRVTFTRRIGAV